MAIVEKKTHFQPGGEVCETAALSDGRVLRVVGFEDYRSVTAELRAWLLWLGLAMVLWGCGGQAFSTERSQAVDIEAGASSEDAGRSDADEAPGEAGASEASSPQDAGVADAAGECGRCSCLPDGAAGCADPPPDAADECLLFTHSDGIGQNWQDCTPPGTYTQSEAMSACAVNSSPCLQHACAAGDEAVCNRDPSVPGYCTCWTYAGPDAGHVNSEPCTSIADAICGGSVAWN